MEKRLEELRQRLGSGRGISSRTASTLKQLCDALSSPQGMDVTSAKRLHLQLVTEDTGTTIQRFLSNHLRTSIIREREFEVVDSCKATSHLLQ